MGDKCEIVILLFTMRFVVMVFSINGGAEGGMWSGGWSVFSDPSSFSATVGDSFTLFRWPSELRRDMESCERAIRVRILGIRQEGNMEWSVKCGGGVY